MTVKINGSGTIGIGTGIPDENLHVFSSTGAIKIDGTGDTALRFATSGTNKFSIFQSGDTLRFFDNSNNAERMRILSDGTLRLGPNSPGIDFSQIQTNASGMTSETLDSYEEGTFTPAAGSPAISGTSPTYTGFYTKIGNIVTCRIVVQSTSNNLNVTSYAVITGLPFTSASSGGKATGTVITEDIDQFDRQGFVNGTNGGTSVFISNCGSTSGTNTLDMTLVYAAA